MGIGDILHLFGPHPVVGAVLVGGPLSAAALGLIAVAARRHPAARWLVGLGVFALGMALATSLALAFHMRFVFLHPFAYPGRELAAAVEAAMVAQSTVATLGLVAAAALTAGFCASIPARRGAATDAWVVGIAAGALAAVVLVFALREATWSGTHHCMDLACRYEALVEEGPGPEPVRQVILALGVAGAVLLGVRRSAWQWQARPLVPRHRDFDESKCAASPHVEVLDSSGGAAPLPPKSAPADFLVPRPSIDRFHCVAVLDGSPVSGARSARGLVVLAAGIAAYAGTRSFARDAAAPVPVWDAPEERKGAESMDLPSAPEDCLPSGSSTEIDIGDPLHDEWIRDGISVADLLQGPSLRSFYAHGATDRPLGVRAPRGAPLADVLADIAVARRLGFHQIYGVARPARRPVESHTLGVFPRTPRTCLVWLPEAIGPMAKVDPHATWGDFLTRPGGSAVP